MGTITGTLTIEKAKKKQEFYTCTMNIKTINEIHNLRNTEEIAQKLGTKIRDLGSKDTVSVRNRNKNRNIKQVTNQEQK